MFSKTVFTYDLETNALSNTADIKPQSLNNYMNTYMSHDDFVAKYHGLNLLPDKTYMTRHTYWAMRVNTYEEVIDSMYSTGAMTLNTDGQLLRQSGCGVTMFVDRDVNALTDESVDTLKNTKSKYSGF